MPATTVEIKPEAPVNAGTTKVLPSRLRWDAEKTAGFLGTMLGSLVSPAWPVFHRLMDPLVQIILEADQPVAGYLELIHHFKALGPQAVLFHYQLPMILLTVFHLAFVALCFRVGSLAYRTYMARRQVLGN
ncbi:MAG: hypothetical protein AB7P76_11655 [Candidatus Melainabacteria bacterium]